MESKMGARLKACNDYSEMLLYADNRHDGLNIFTEGVHVYVSRTG